MKELSLEMRNEIVNLTKEGKSQLDIHDIIGISTSTIRKYQRSAGLLINNPRDKGGRISKTILMPPFEEKTKDEKEKEVLPVMIADQSLKIAGTETLNVYNVELTKDYVNIEGKNMVGEVKISDIPKLIDELKGVQKMALQMKSNRWGLM